MALLCSFTRYSASQFEWPWLWFFKVTQGQMWQSRWTPHIYFPITFYSNVWTNSGPLQDIRLQNLSDIEFDLSRSLKVKCDSVIGLPIYAFLSVFNSNIWPNFAPLQDIRLQNRSDLESDLSRSLKVKCDIIGLVIHGFVLIYPVVTCLTLTV